MKLIIRKGFILFLSLALIIGLLSGCGREEAEPEKVGERVEEKIAEPNDISEPGAVDDSYAFTVPENLDISLIKYFKENVLPGYAGRMTESGRILDVQLAADFAGSRVLIYGWVLLDCTAKDNNWRNVEIDGEQLYCRSIFAIGDGEGSQWQARKSSYMKPAERIARTEGTAIADTELKGLTGAELYVNQLGKSYLQDDAEVLRRLEKALSISEEYFNFPSPPLSSAEFLNPLYLYFEDGSVRLVHTIGSGAPGNDCFSRGSLRGPESIFELMGVPLKAEGYEKATDGSMSLSVNMPSVSVRDSGESEYSYTITILYDSVGRLISIDSPDEQREMLFREFQYNEAGQLESINTYVSGQLVNIDELQYDSKGLILRRSSHSPDMCSGYYREYIYDSENRITADIFHKLDGTEGGIESNVYYWYDENGEQHIYSFNPDGSINGDAPDEAAIRR